MHNLSPYLDIAEATYFSPVLKTIRQLLRKLGILEIKILLAPIEGAAKPVRYISTLPAKLAIHTGTTIVERAYL